MYQTKAIATFESKEKVTRNHIIFFHGGAYIFNTTPAHWRLSEKIVKGSFCRMTHIDYPLAPEHQYKQTFTMVSGAYDLLTDKYPTDNFIFMGDSAGGGLALAFAQKLFTENHKKLPVMIFLLSPWLDLTLSNPAIKRLENSDQILTVKMLKHAAMKYSKGDNQDQYLLSPINGELTNLPNTIVFYGTEELFYADCVRLKSMTDRSNLNYIYREYHKMQHDWALFPIPERKQLIGEICDFINGKRQS
jgi:acetyl esterase/lipase